jgi:uncharacterized repeat protein (TIGR01451 family)
MRLAVGVLVVLGAAVLVPAAFAHDSGLSVAATCNTSTGNYDVTWTVGYTDFRNLSPKIAASNRAAIPVGTALVVPNTPFTESVAGTTTSISATITVTWSDGVTKTYTKALNLAGNCVQDTGSLKLTKSLSGGPQGYTGPFTIGYACDLAHTGTVSVPAGSSATISGIPLGTVCTVNESVPTPPSGYSFGPVTFTDNSGTANDGIVTITTKGATVEVTVNNSLSRDQGYLRIVKVFDANSSGFTGAFSIRYQCGAAAAQTVALAAGASAIAGPFDTETVCTVSEPSLPSAPSGWTFGSPSISGSPATIVKGTAATPVTVTVTNTITQNSTPPPPPSPKTDITVTKTATPAVTLPLGGGTAPITYQMVVSNNGPDPAANVKVVDAAPVSVTFISATTSAGSCTTTALALDCSVGTLAVGGSATITVNATVNSTGTKVNVVTVTTTTPETNPNNNQAQAQTIVTAPAVPPPTTPKPKPKPAPVICTTVVALQKTLKANGKTQTVKLKVTQGTKRVVARIKLTGPGFSKTVRTGKNGLVTVSLKPSKAGIVKVQIVGTKACNTQRLGVVGVFEPPLTG